MSQFLVPIDADSGAEDELNSFLRSHKVIDIQRVLVPSKGWSFCVEWIDGAVFQNRTNRGAERVDYMKELEPATFAVFSRLRTLRKDLAREAGIPSFTIATDAQLASIAKIEDPSLEKMVLP